MHAFNNVKLKPRPQKYTQDISEIYTPLKGRIRNLTNIRKNDTDMPKAVQSLKLEHENRRYEADTIRNITRKSIDVSLTQPTRQPNVTIYQANQPAKSYYKRISQNFRRQLGLKRYDEEEQHSRNKSPYLKKELRSNPLNRSSNKIKSGQLAKQHSPYQFYRQPRSSLSQHYDPTIETSLHKRRVSLINQHGHNLLEEAKQYYKGSNYARSIDILKKFVKSNRNSAEGQYLLGMSLINTNELTLGIDSLLLTLEIDSQYKRSLYLVVALAFKKLNKYEQAISILTKGLDIYPDYYDCRVYRGKLYLKLLQYDLALKDFTIAIAESPAKGFAYVGKGTCEKELNMKDQAIATFTDGLETDMKHICFEKRGTIFYEQNQYDLALRDYECSLQNNSSSSVHYFKGMIYYKQRKLVEALLCFEQALKCDNHRENLTKSVEMMLIIKVEEKDFYEAYHILNRTDGVDIEKEAIHQWRLFLQASLFLMKKKYKDGIDTFKALLHSLKHQNKERYIFLKPLIHLYKAFGELNQGKVDNAKKDYDRHTELCRQFNIPDDNLSKNYNLLIMEIYREFPKSSRQIQQAIQLIPTKPQPYLLLAFDIVQNKCVNEEPSGAATNEVIQALSMGISQLPQLSNNHISTFYYYRAILHLYKGQFNKSVNDIDKAIEKSQDNIPKYFHLRGLIFACFGNFSQSVQDLSVAINLDEKFAKAYLERAKCLQIEGNSNEAFLDLQKYITLSPQDQNIHKYAGFLLFQNCAYQDCLAAFKHGTTSDDPQLTITKGKCHFLLGEYETALEEFKEFNRNDSLHQFESDISIIQICRQIKKDTPKDQLRHMISSINDIVSLISDDDCRIFKFRDMHQIMASIFLILGEYDEAIAHFTKTLELFNIEKKKQMEKNFVEDSQQFQDEWSEVEIKFNLSLCYLARKQYQTAKSILIEFENCSEKGKNWATYLNLIDQLILNTQETKRIQIDTFEQNHRISKNWPRFQLPSLNIHISLAFSYPFVEPPELMPQFDRSLFNEFTISNAENKPQAPWINRCDKGLVFTPNVQMYDNLELSVTTQQKDSEKKPASQMEQSVDLSQSDFQLETEQLKKKFKLDSLVQMKLQRLMKK